jgi:hypothetical protein
MLEALLNHRLLMFELENRRIIVGYVVQLPAFDRRAAFVSILPMSTGIRNDQGRVELHRSYEAWYASQPDPGDPERLKITVDVEKIETVNRFDVDAYRLWSADPSSPAVP